MNLRNYVGLLALLLICTGCPNDDDREPDQIPVRDRGEQSLSDDELLQAFLQTHFYNYEEFENPPADFDYVVRIDTIARENSDKEPILNRDELEVITIDQFETINTLYVLRARQGTSERPPSSFADSVLVEFEGTLLYRYDDLDQDGIPNYADASFPDNEGTAGMRPGDTNDNDNNDDDGDDIIDEFDADNDGEEGTDPGVIDEDQNGIIDNATGVFDKATTPIWFNLAGTIPGFARGLEGFKPAGIGPIISPDGTVSYDEFSSGAVFIPSGLGYFNQPPAGIPFYESLIFKFQSFDVRITDHDGDKILSINEDIDNNKFLFDEIDNTDGDSAFNFNDPDDDNDGVRTRLEIVTEGEGDDEVFVAFLDTDGDGTPNHLDVDDDGDGRDTANEIDFNTITGEVTFPDTDLDGIPDYLDPDS